MILLSFILVLSPNLNCELFALIILVGISYESLDLKLVMTILLFKVVLSQSLAFC